MLNGPGGATRRDPGTPPPTGGPPAASAPLLPSVSLPTGGGALRGIGEAFAMNPVTGTATLTVPLPLPSGRGGFAPQLALAYDSGAGNGPFGFGWRLETPSITRRTDRGIPRYLDAEESDVFLLAGAEDLVPVDDPPRPPRVVRGVAYHVRRYRPRVDGLFARIERWTDAASGATHWRSITRDNVTTLYGTDASARITHPADDGVQHLPRVFAWLIRASYDDRGNVVVYEHVPERDAGIDVAQASEAHRTTASRGVNRYLKRIRYGNARPFAADRAEAGVGAAFPTEWHFEVVLDYGDHAGDTPTPTPDREPAVRPDPFSTFRAGFEVRTYRRCARVLVFHHFAGEPDVGGDCLVRSLALTYADALVPTDARDASYTFLRSITQRGHRRLPAGGYVTRELPPLELAYGAPRISDTVATLDADGAANLPEGVDGGRFQWVDLDGEGLPGILAREPGAWRYKRNVAPLAAAAAPTAAFGPAELVATMPGGVGDGDDARLVDLSGDGQLDVVSLDGPTPGFRERTPDARWAPYRPFASLPNVDWREPNIRLVDLTGDGLADALRTEDGCFTFYPSLGEDGFGAGTTVPVPADESRGPRVVFADGEGAIFLADMTGDGLSDLVRVRDGEVCYWPNLGYGRFGARVTMDAAPRVTGGERFDPRRVRLADVDGSGPADLLYVGADGVALYANCSGNRWAAPRRLRVFPDASGNVDVVDLLGTGTACLVWSSSLPAAAGAPLRYVDLMSGAKPHLLTLVRNNLGAETRLTYAPSTRFYVADRAAGRPWVTRLPFPVHVLERVERDDLVGRARFVTRYAYHHGHFDGAEREFRGFGLVEQWDTEEYRDDASVPGAANWDAASHVPPVLTRRWFHTGAFVEAGIVSWQYDREYWVEPTLRHAARAADRAAMRLPDSRLPAGIAADERREAYRALRGSTLRTEVYARDGSPRAEHPYTVTEECFEVRRVQPRGARRHAVFLVVPRERIELTYERQADDPRVRHDLTLEVDDYGGVTRSVTVGYGRRAAAALEPTLPADFQRTLAYDQARLHATGTATRYTTPLTDWLAHPDDHRTPLLAEQTVAELTGIAPASQRPGVTNLFRFEELDALWPTLWDGAHDAPSEELPTSDLDGVGTPAAAPPRRVVARTRVRYRRDDLGGLLPLGDLEPRALPGDRWSLAFPAGLAARVVGPEVTDAALVEGGYVRLDDGGWWAPTGRVHYSPGDADPPAAELAAARAHFYQPRRAVDPFGAVWRVAFDAYDLLPASLTDPLGNHTAAANDYRVLQPALVTDANGNRRHVAYDALGLPALTAVAGKTAEALGDTLAGASPDLPEAAVLAHLADPLADPAAALGGATTRLLYDLHAYHRTRAAQQPSPAVVCTIARETHASALAPGERTRFHHTLAYSDGFAREIQRKVLAAPDPTAPDTPRWVGTGWTIFDNKGRPARRYEPFFTATPAFEFAHAVGVSDVLFRDPLGRVVGTLHPDRSWEKTRFDAWRYDVWDGNDTAGVADPRTDLDVGPHFARLLGAAPGAFLSWREERALGLVGATPAERAAATDAAAKALAHADTPSALHLDALGRPCLQVADAGAAGRAATRTARDVLGRPLAVLDALGRRAVQHGRPGVAANGGARFLAGYDLVGHTVYHVGMDGGERRALLAVDGQEVRAWDGLGRAFRLRHDALRRPSHRYVRATGGPEILLERSVYGEGRTAENLGGRLWRRYDASGLSANERYDFAGNLVATSRHLARAYRVATDWSPLDALSSEAALDAAAAPLLDPIDRYVAGTTYDALRRPVQTVLPSGGTVLPSVVRTRYDVRGFVAGVDLWVRRAAAPMSLLDPATADVRAVAAVDYDARGQRVALDLGNGTRTTYDHDPATFRLARLTTTRPAAFAADARVVQRLAYAYDAVGNVTRVDDTADTQNVVFFRNRRVEPSCDYTYDPLYRLVAATGREQLGLTNGQRAAPLPPGGSDGGRAGIAHPGDGNALDRYAEAYAYDAVGNIRAVVHAVATGQWTRAYERAEPSAVDAAVIGNRVSGTARQGDAPGTFADRYGYDAHGNTTRMPHLPTMSWDEDDRLRSTARQVVSAGTPETTYHTYGADGTRVRKVTEGAAAAHVDPRRRAERIYLGAIEIHREYDAAGAVTLERETVHVDGGGRRAALVETRTAGGSSAPARLVRYQYGNQLGSAALELDAAASIVSYEEYYPYGATSYQAVRAGLETPKRYRHTGKERDEESGLYYHGARYYAPWLGLWISCDPGALRDPLTGTRADGLRADDLEPVQAGSADERALAAPRYQYVGCDPIAYRDPDGRDKDGGPVDGISTIHVQEQFSVWSADPKFLGEMDKASTKAVRVKVREDDTTAETKQAIANAKPGDAVVLVGHSVTSRATGKVVGMETDDWIGDDTIKGTDIAAAAKDASPPSVIVLAGCNTEDLGPAVKGSGARVVIGVRGSPGPTQIERSTGVLVKELAAGKTVQEALTEANKVQGADTLHPASFVVLEGDPAELGRTLPQLGAAGPASAPDAAAPQKQAETPATVP